MVLRKSFYIRWSAGRSPRVHEVNPGRDPSDVDCPKKLRFLADSPEWFGGGSIIILTTRNTCCLNVNKAYSSYEAKGLAKNKALELFIWNAFKQHYPTDNYVDLCNRVLHRAKGLPLALVVLGSSLFQGMRSIGKASRIDKNDPSRRHPKGAPSKL